MARYKRNVSTTLVSESVCCFFLLLTLNAPTSVCIFSILLSIYIYISLSDDEENFVTFVTRFLLCVLFT